MLTKHLNDHVLKHSPVCGEIREIIVGDEYRPNVAIAVNILPTTGHYHTTFDEIYFVLDGELSLALHDPQTKKTWTERLTANELCVVSKHIHHRITQASPTNRLCVISVPQFRPDDEHTSDVLSDSVQTENC